MNQFDPAAFDFAAALAARKAEFGEMQMAYIDPPAGTASDNVSPVTASQVPAGKLVHVGPRDAAGLPTGSNEVDQFVSKAYDLAAYQPFRRRLLFDTFATLRVTRQSHNGAVVALSRVGDLDDDPTTAELHEDFDVLPTPLVAHGSNIILKEYGRVVTKTALIRATSMIPLDPIAAERVGRNMGATVDRIALNAALAAGGIKIDGTAGAVPVDQTGTAVSASNQLRAVHQYFLDNNVEPFEDGFYAAAITPAAQTQLLKESDAAGWRYFQQNQNPAGGTGSIAKGYVGDYEGFHFFVTTGVPAATGGVFFGAEGLAKAGSMVPGFGMEPQVVVAPVVDRLRRFASVGWYWLGGYARFRAEAIATSNLSDIT